MRKGTLFDTYDPAKIDAMREAQKPVAKAVPKHQPPIYACIKCGDTIGPHWGEYGEFFCRLCAPDHLKHPGAAANAS